MAAWSQWSLAATDLHRVSTANASSIVGRRGASVQVAHYDVHKLVPVQLLSPDSSRPALLCFLYELRRGGWGAIEDHHEKMYANRKRSLSVGPIDKLLITQWAMEEMCSGFLREIKSTTRKYTEEPEQSLSFFRVRNPENRAPPVKTELQRAHIVEKPEKKQQLLI
ncbi:hypothetical protein EVAR_102863_1 [Eumeta japonica]|uniref:Uncharacterized protein n=1 Tax=Eumeta variegata TaxID=151549 RepID=A0A4C1UN56_EUMVA|nr:hypothetical protein EVAR_102863_1 [Eumeta japonica]